MDEDGKNVGRARILIISDDQHGADSISQDLNSNGFVTGICIVKSKSDKIIPNINADLIIIDTCDKELLYNSMCPNLKKNITGGEIPVLLVDERENIEKSVRVCSPGILDYVLRPFDKSELIARVKTHLKLKLYLNEIEEKNRQLEKLNAEKNEFLGLAAHDLKNPIYNISMLAKVLRDDDMLSRVEVTEFSQDIVDTAERMLNLIKKLLDINAIEIGRIDIKQESVDLNQIARELVNAYKVRAAAKNIKLNFTDNTGLPFVLADWNATIQIIDNILSNAIKYSPFDKNVYINIIERDGFAGIEIRDEGPGLSEDDKKNLFGKFTRLSARPTGEEHSSGLGLSIVKKYVEAMNGIIKCESESMQGATFTVLLPKIV